MPNDVTMPSNHHIRIHITSDSPKTNSSKLVDEKRGRVAWPVEKNYTKRSKTGSWSMYASSRTINI